MITPYPLNWPLAYPRTLFPQKSKFSPNMNKSRDGLLHELQLLKAKDVVISSNVPVRTDGIPYSNWERRIVKDHGVAVYFHLKDKPVVLCCDKWKTVEENIHAIYLSIEAMRALDRWGVSDMLDRVFTGFEALPVSDGEWYVVLGVSKNAPHEEVKAAYRNLTKDCHPDSGIRPNREEFERVQKAWEKFQSTL